MKNRKITPDSVLSTQKNLSNEFIVDYILNKEYAVFSEDYDITINMINGMYPNFRKFDIESYLKNKNK